MLKRRVSVFSYVLSWRAIGAKPLRTWKNARLRGKIKSAGTLRVAALRDAAAVRVLLYCGVLLAILYADHDDCML